MLFGFATLCAAQGQRVYNIDTIVGGAVYDNLPATSTPLSLPTGLWLDRDGGLYIADTANHVIRKLDLSSGLLKVVAGGGTVIEDAVPVSALSARLERPLYLVGDTAGNILFTDSASHRVRRLTPDGQVTTVAGTGIAGFTGDGGPARLARLNTPTGLALDTGGNLYIADFGNCRIRRVDAAGAITTYAGTGNCGESGEGQPALNAGIGNHQMNGLGLDSKGNVYVTSATTIRRIDRATGIITTVVGVFNENNCSPLPDGSRPTARAICHPRGVLFDQDDNLYFTYVSGLARVSAATGLVSNLAGGWEAGGLARSSSGRLFFSVVNSNRVQQVESSGTVTTVAGTELAYDGPARLAALILPQSLAFDSSGNLYISELQRRIRRLDLASGLITTVAGGGRTFIADGVAALSLQDDIRNLSVDGQDNVFFNDPTAIWKLDPRLGTVTRVAGKLGQQIFSGDGGPARDATFVHVNSFIADAAGNLYISDGSHRVRRVDSATGIINTIAGNGTNGTSGDGGPGAAAAVGNPGHLAFDPQGQLLISHNCTLRRLNLSTRIITSVQARVQEGGALANLRDLPGLCVAVPAADRDGNIFLTTSSARVVQIRASDSLLAPVAGSSEGFAGDGGLATVARLTQPNYLVVDASGNVYVSDSGNGRVRKLTPTLCPAAHHIQCELAALQLDAGDYHQRRRQLAVRQLHVRPGTLHRAHHGGRLPPRPWHLPRHGDHQVG